MNDRQYNSAIELLESAAVELAQIHRSKDYYHWRGSSQEHLNQALSQIEPFSDFCSVWIYNGDGGGAAATARFGEWAIDQLVKKMTPQDIIAAFSAEVER